jgi:hypothetical protein
MASLVSNAAAIFAARGPTSAPCVRRPGAKIQRIRTGKNTKNATKADIPNRPELVNCLELVTQCCESWKNYKTENVRYVEESLNSLKLDYVWIIATQQDFLEACFAGIAILRLDYSKTI